MENRNMFFGIIGLLILAVIGLAVDRSNQITTLTEQANTVATQAQEAGDELQATIDAQADEIVAQAEIAETAQSDAEEQANLAATSEADAIIAAADAVEQANLAATQAALGATAAADALMQAELAATSEADSMAINADMSTEIADLMAQSDDFATQVADLSAQRDDLSAQVEALQPTATPSPEPEIEPETSASAVSELEFAFQIDVANLGAVQISPDDASIAVLRDDNVIQLFSAEDGTPQLELDSFEATLSEFIYASDGRSMAAVADDSGIIVFDSATGSASFEEDYSNPVRGFAFSPDGDAIIVGTPRNIEIKVLDAAQVQSRQDGVTGLDWSADGTQIVITTGRSVSIFDIVDNAIDSTTDLDVEGQIVDVTFSPDGAYIAGVTVDAELVIISVEDGDVAWQTSVDAEDIDDLAWSSDSQHIAVVADGDIRIYGVDGTWAVQATLDGATAVDWSSDDAFLVLANAEQVSVIEVASLME